MLKIRPITQKAAFAWIREVHRHHQPPVGSVFQVALESDGKLCGVAIAGRPLARTWDDGVTLEVLRVATDGTRNACSMLYGACVKAAFALGYTRLVTYTLPEEGGASLRGAGWALDGETNGGTWARKGRRLALLSVLGASAPTEGSKSRWVLHKARRAT